MFSNIYVFMSNIYLEKLDHSKQIEALSLKVKEHEHRAMSYFQKYAKLQGDYHNLIGIAAELVDTLEKNVRGQMVSLNLSAIELEIMLLRYKVNNNKKVAMFITVKFLNFHPVFCIFKLI